MSPSAGLDEGWSLFAGLPRAASRGLFDLLLLWQERAAQRYALSMLDAHALKDIGLTRAEAEREAGKPFWRA
ncbi:MAG: DUF1127 domain-containing protein [Kiloniellales bacterium]